MRDPTIRDRFISYETICALFNDTAGILRERQYVVTLDCSAGMDILMVVDAHGIDCKLRAFHGCSCFILSGMGIRYLHKLDAKNIANVITRYLGP